MQDQDDNVISLKTRTPFREEEAQKAAEKVEIHSKDKAGQLEAWDNIRKLIEDDKLEGFLVIARSPRGVFLTEVAMPTAGPVETLYSYIGVMGSLRLELEDAATNIPCMLNDGTIVAPESVAEFIE